MGTPSPAGSSNLGAESKSPGRVIPFGKYLLLDRLAVGGMAEVYVAKSFGIEGFEKLLAIKRILPTMAEDEDFIEMFIDEAKIAGQLGHANVVPIYELGKLGESHYIAMEYVWGKDLLQIMNRFRRLRKRMPAVMVGWIAAKICEALEYAHGKRDRRGNPLNIIHRDISPQNVLVSYEGQVKLIDFGIAKAASRTTKTQAGVLKGKFGYMSPEQVRGQPIDHRSDLFAVGTCMYEMITSERLFLSESDFSTLEKVRNAEVAPPSSIVQETPKELEEIVMRALKREPGDRFQRAGEMQEALQRFLASHDPPFTTARLSSWLKTAFSTEMGQEKAKMDSFAQIGRPSVLSGGAVGGPRPPDVDTKQVSPDVATAQALERSSPSLIESAPPVAITSPAAQDTREEGRPRQPERVPEPAAVSVEGSHAAMAQESTQVTPSPFEATQLAESRDDLAEQPTEIFFSAYEDLASPAAEAPAPGKPARQWAPAEHQSSTDERWPPPPAVLDPTETLVPRVVDSSAEGYEDAPPRIAEAGPAAQEVSFPRVPESGAPAPGARSAAAARSRLLVAAAILAAAALGLGALFPILFGGDPVGTLEVRVVPEIRSATFQVDGRPAGSGPEQILELPEGDHTLVIDAPEYTRYHRIVRIERDLKVVLEIALQPDRPTTAVAAAPGQALSAPLVEPPNPGPPIVATSNEATAARAGTTPTAEPRSVETVPVRPPREESTERSAPTQPTKGEASRNEATREIEPREARPPRPAGAPAAPAPGPAEFGTLIVNSLPWARVFIDGRDTGRNTPITGMRVRAGSHTIGLKTPDGQMHNFTVDIESGETERLSRSLQ